MSGLGDFFYLQQSFGKTRNSPSHAAFAFSYSLRLLILGSFYCCLKKKQLLTVNTKLWWRRWCRVVNAWRQLNNERSIRRWNFKTSQTLSFKFEKTGGIKSVNHLLPVRNKPNLFNTLPNSTKLHYSCTNDQNWGAQLEVWIYLNQFIRVAAEQGSNVFRFYQKKSRDYINKLLTGQHINNECKLDLK